MEKYTNDSGKECYRGCATDSPFSADLFHQVDMSWQTEQRDSQIALHTNLGTITVLERMTGFGWLDTETGYRDPDGKFWLASGMQDVRESDCKTLGEAIRWVKDRANNCVGE